MKTKKCLIGFLVAMLACGGSTIAFAKSGGASSHSAGGPGRGIGTEERVEKKGAEGQEQGKHKGESKKKKNVKSKGTTERATHATPAVPTPGTPKAVSAIPATPSK